MAVNRNAQVQTSEYKDLIFGEMTIADVETVKQTIAADCTPEQFVLFMGMSRTIGAYPNLGEIFPSVYQGKLTVQYAVDLYVRKAKETPGYQGYDVQLIYEKDDFEANQTDMEDGRSYMKVTHKINGIQRGKILGGYAIAYKAMMTPFVVFMDAEDVEHFKRSTIGMQRTMWTKYFVEMFKKHLTKRALKGQFGLAFSGVADAELSTPELVDVTDYQEDLETVTHDSNEPVRETNEPEVVNPGGKAQTEEPTTVSPEAIRLKTEVIAKAKRLGINTPGKVKEYCKNNDLPLSKDWDNPSELSAIISTMDLDIMEKEMDGATI